MGWLKDILVIAGLAFTIAQTIDKILDIIKKFKELTSQNEK
ncbi:hypothetical protein [Orenia marismortui]|nr:hypothetical protein [Orenia marismortui]